LEGTVVEMLSVSENWKSSRFPGLFERYVPARFTGIFEAYGIKTNEFELLRVTIEKGYSKFELAKNIILRRLKEEGKEKISIQSIDTMIQNAVTRFFGKK
jgi:hypothetical protein